MANRKGKVDAGDVATNRRARHKFELLDRFECGIELVGTEVKSLREGKAQLGDAYAVIERREVWLRNAHIPPYAPASGQNHDPERPRKLLLHRHEIERLIGRSERRGLTLIPTRTPTAISDVSTPYPTPGESSTKSMITFRHISRMNHAPCFLR